MLLDDIITILSDESGSLSSALLKTKVLLHTIGKKDLASWVNHELQGYPPKEPVPDYRRVTAEVHGHVSGFAWHMADTKLPILHLKEEERKNLTSMQCRMSISSIEEAVKAYRAKGSGLMTTLPPEFGRKFKKALQPGVEVISAWCEINMIQVEGIVTQVRSRLLDFALELRGVVGMDAPEAELIKKTANLDTERMFGTAIFGDGNTIIIGSQNVHAITNQKDDIEGLIRAVGQLGFEQQMLADLRAAVDDDKGSGRVPDVADGKTGEWFSKALKEAGKGVVKGGIDVVSSVIVKALKAYTTGAP